MFNKMVILLLIRFPLPFYIHVGFFQPSFGIFGES